MRQEPVTRIFIRDLELLARMGVHGHEQGTQQPVRINVEIETETAPDADRLEDAVDYETVANAIRDVIDAGHINLAETLAEKIAAVCLADPRSVRARVRVEKLHALKGAEAAGVEIVRMRDGR